MMYDEVAIMDENLLAATVILRWLEEVDGQFVPGISEVLELTRFYVRSTPIWL